MAGGTALFGYDTPARRPDPAFPVSRTTTDRIDSSSTSARPADARGGHFTVLNALPWPNTYGFSVARTVQARNTT